MKRLAIVLVSLALVAGSVGVVAKQDEPKEEKKVTICHATSSETNPWVRIVVSENAIGGHFDNPGTPKAGHEDDVLLQGDVDCPVPTTPPVTPPVDTPKTETPATSTPEQVQPEVPSSALK